MKTIRETGMKGLFFLSACSSIFAVFFICLFMFMNGVPTIKEIGFFNFIFGTSWQPLNNVFGIFPMIVGSIYVSGLAMLIGIPIGVLSAVYMVYYCPKKIYPYYKQAVNLLAGIPSIVYGFFGLVVMVPLIRTYVGGSGKGVLTSAILLGIMVLPTIISVCESSLQASSKTYYEGALALGATHERSIFKACLPAAKSGIMTAIILGVCRAIGESMALNMVAGNQAIIPESLVSGVRTLTTNIVLEMGYATDMHRQALIATAVVLFAFILIINLSFAILKRRNKR